MKIDAGRFFGLLQGLASGFLIGLYVLTDVTPLWALLVGILGALLQVVLLFTPPTTLWK